MPFWKRKKQDDIITLGLHREATVEEKKIAEKRDEGPEADFLEKFQDAVAATRENIADKLDVVFAGKRELDADVLDKLEEALIGADIGVQTSLDIIEKARKQMQRQQLNDVDE